MVGILCAWMLDRVGVDYMLVEAESIGSGMTKKTIAKLTVQHRSYVIALEHALELNGMYVDEAEKGCR
ncbi:MAG: hypothetical protein ACI39W_08095 [Brotaphodocola sp.]